MNFTDLDLKMRAFEELNDQYVPPEIYMVARIDGRSFTKLTKDKCNFEAPFDIRFRDMMLGTAKHLMNCGFRVLYGYTQSDEISLLLHKDDQTFSRKERKLNSILAGEASAIFSHLIGGIAAFDCRISQLPTPQLVVDYFRWRQEDSHRNSLSAHCYWSLRKQGWTKQQATEQLNGMSTAAKNELLFSQGINFNDLPNWQKRGVGIIWGTVRKAAWNPKERREVTAERRALEEVHNLPLRDDYSEMIRSLLNES